MNNFIQAQTMLAKKLTGITINKNAVAFFQPATESKTHIYFLVAKSGNYLSLIIEEPYETFKERFFADK